jgi:hypothetical protein
MNVEVSRRELVIAFDKLKGVLLFSLKLFDTWNKNKLMENMMKAVFLLG